MAWLRAFTPFLARLTSLTTRETIVLSWGAAPSALMLSRTARILRAQGPRTGIVRVQRVTCARHRKIGRHGLRPPRAPERVARYHKRLSPQGLLRALLRT